MIYLDELMTLLGDVPPTFKGEYQNVDYPVPFRLVDVLQIEPSDNRELCGHAINVDGLYSVRCISNNATGAATIALNTYTQLDSKYVGKGIIQCSLYPTLQEINEHPALYTSTVEVRIIEGF